MRSYIRFNFVFTRYLFLIPVFLFLGGTMVLKGQEPPPRPIRITSTGQNLGFGAFYHGASGGTVIVDPNSVRTATGDVVLINLGFTYSAAVFEVHAHPGTIIAILNNNPYSLTGTPSGSMVLNITSTNPTSPFVNTAHFNVPTYLYVGGTLSVGNSAANPPGSYTGTFNITLVRE
jgi:hypothetical protein